jgi:hypothetical protein
MKHPESDTYDSFSEWMEYMADKYPAPKKRWFHRFKRSYIVSRYTSHEFISTEDSWCKLFLRIKYHRDGYTSIRDLFYPPKRIANLLFKAFGWNTYNFNSNINIERHRPGTGQVTHYSPWSNI